MNSLKKCNCDVSLTNDVFMRRRNDNVHIPGIHIQYKIYKYQTWIHGHRMPSKVKCYVAGRVWHLNLSELLLDWLSVDHADVSWVPHQMCTSLLDCYRVI